MRKPVEKQPPSIAFPAWAAVLFWMGLLFLGSANLTAQTTFQAFKQSPPPLRRWVICHPFIAKKTFKTSKMALATADSMRISPRLDGMWSGGSLDAFRHGFWMASLVQVISEKKARKLGLAYEKGNYWMFRKRKLEDGQQQDQVSSEMDLFNNEMGRKLGREHLGEGKRALLEAVLQAIEGSEFVQIAMDAEGNSLDAQGQLIPNAVWQGKWLNDRVLVPTGR